MKIAVLMTCYNRVATTLECLRHLLGSQCPDGVGIDVWLVDDRSPDKTGEAVVRTYPSVHVIQGTGSLYWCGGMRLAWSTASETNDYDGYLWLNDDTMLLPDAIRTMLEDEDCMRLKNGCPVIISGCVSDDIGRAATYSGRDENDTLLSPAGEPQKVRVMNGNCVFISQRVFQELGNFPPYFTHAFGDYDYALRAAKLGIAAYISSRWVGRCNSNESLKAARGTLRQRLAALYSPKSNPGALFRFCLKHNGFVYATKLWIKQHLKVVCSKI